MSEILSLSDAEHGHRSPSPGRGASLRPGQSTARSASGGEEVPPPPGAVGGGLSFRRWLRRGARDIARRLPSSREGNTDG